VRRTDSQRGAGRRNRGPVYASSQAAWYVVSNEVGLGIVPAYPLGRLYRDVLGRANQQLAAAADRVLFLVAGLPMLVKGSGG
jgi:adenosylcobinamide kinase/adenosylcobinamide-phosphate guanylyltransferase